MEQQELLTAWNDLQIRVEKYASRQVDLERQVNQTRSNRVRTRATWSLAWDTAVAGLTLLATGNFAADHFAELVAMPAAALPALVLFVLAVWHLNLAIRQLLLVGGLDYSKPVVEAQVTLAKLRKLRFQATRWTFLCALPVWVAFPILLGQWAINVKLIFAISPAWIIGNVLFGLAMAPVINWMMVKSQYAQSLQDTIAGKDILEAEEFLSQIEEFRRG